MIESLLTFSWFNFSLLNPGALLLGLVAPVLIFAYLKSKSATTMVVPTIMILQKLKARTAMRSRFSLPLRFFLELLALILLTLAASHPLWHQSDERIAVVIDNSLSMSAIGANGTTRYADALKKASYLPELSSGLLTPFVSTPHLTALSQEPQSLSKCLELLGSVGTTSLADNLSSELTQLADGGIYNKIILLTDQEAKYYVLQPPSAPTSSRALISTKLSAIRIGSTQENAFINYARLQKGESDGEITVGLTYSGMVNQKATVELFGIPLLDIADLEATKDMKAVTTAESISVDKKSVLLTPDKTIEVMFSVPLRNDIAWEVKLALSDTNPSRDTIATDNQAWLAPLRASSNRALLVSPLVADTVAPTDTSPASTALSTSATTNLGLSKFLMLSFTSISPQHFQNMSQKELESYQLHIFHRTSPLVLSNVPTLLILPPDNNPFVTAKNTVTKPRITSWREEHALLTYLRLSTLEPEQALALATPSWGYPLINIEEGPILVAGETNAVRRAVLGVEILPFEGRANPTLSVLSANILNWLINSSNKEQVNSSSSLAPGYFDSESVDGKQTILRPIKLSDGANNDRKHNSLKTPGLYLRASRSQVPPTIEVVNSFFPRESATSETVSLSIPETVYSESDPQEISISRYSLFLNLVILVLLLELILRTIRRFRL